jgi:apolipoprotein N-acyltransferase
LALFFALGTAAATALRFQGIARILVLAAAIGASEWLRGNILSGFPWNALGYALTGNDALVQSASLIGVTGLSFVAVLVFALPAAAVQPSGLSGWNRRALLPIAASVALLTAMLVFGAWRLAGPERSDEGQARLRLVQPNIPQAEKWLGENRQRIFRTFLDLSRRDPSGREVGFEGITHVIWPESSLPFLMLQSPEALQAIDALLPDDRVLITGSLRAETASDGTLTERGGLYTIYNDIAVIDGRGAVIATFDKLHLVPFGEYLPAQRTLESMGLEQLTRLKGGFASGSGARALRLPGLPPVLPLICYEAIFPEEISRGDDRKWLLNLTNDAWFGDSAGPYQHMLQARLRAVEQGLPLIRVANTGISAVIDAHGIIRASLPLNTRGVIETALPAALPPTVYSRFGDAAALLIAALLLGLALLLGATAGRETHEELAKP